jgi:hypothetical protein
MEERTYIVLKGLEGNPPPQTSSTQAWVLAHVDVFVGCWSVLLALTVLGVVYWIVTDGPPGPGEGGVD